MLTSISPLGERARGNRFWRTAAAYVVGSLLGGGLVGAALGALGDLVEPGETAAWIAVAVAAVFGVVLDVTGRLPTVHRQVDERWLGTYRGWVYGFGYGIQLGTGVATIVTASVTYIVMLTAFLTASTIGGTTIGLTFGLLRALPLLVTSRVGSPEQLAHLHQRVDDVARPAARLAWAAQVCIAVAAVGMAA